MPALLANFGSDMWVQLLSNFGPLIGVVLFFIWRDWKREDALTTRVQALEDYQKETLLNLVERSTTALAQNAECLRWVARVMERLCSRCPFVEAQEAPKGVRDDRR